ncbi:selenocysteine-specific translation elongation factor [Brevibacterium permense]|uniref:selenocysteine-specific translation elongation factor n=1 Tax=Brevibacterium permense TaxID=234834 RepID=UPI0021CED030|nr:selenocysteine-specific translation elongation factor [Brevibacterium permense]MCU4297316.1 selenocysteine-specific translation elongation factor [Brevibacterium permense]
MTETPRTADAAAPGTFVIATAGHVDHGKSTLVGALTGMEPDRWAEEKKRGLTIDLGFAWTTLPSGRELAFVDVPGHEKFLANMLAGLGPAPIACFVIAADKGWQAQSSDHRDAINALGITHGLVVVTRADLAPDSVETTKAQVSAQLRGTTLEAAPIVTVSATTGEGLPELISVLDEVTATAEAPSASGRVRLWIDRAFTIKGAGTVVTGTLTAGTLTTGDTVELRGDTIDRTVGVRGLQSRNSTTTEVVPQARVAVNLRDVPADDLHRGDALLTPEAWPIVDTIDVRRTMGEALDSGIHELMAHIGTAAVPARLRSFAADHARLTLDRPLPLQVSDRIVLRAPGSRNVFAGLLVLDVDPPELTRRGDGARRAQLLAERPSEGDLLAEVARRGAVERSVLTRFGLQIPVDDSLPAEVEDMGGWLVHSPALTTWVEAAKSLVSHELTASPMAAGVPVKAVAEALRRTSGTGRRRPGEPKDDASPNGKTPSTHPLPESTGTATRTLLGEIISRAGLEAVDGIVRPPGHIAGLGEAEAGIAEIEHRLAADPFAAPEADDLRELGLGVRELAVAEKAGRILRLGDGIIVSPRTPAQAMRILAGLDQPFTTSQARQALGTTRRVVIPLLEHLDGRGWTRRLDTTHREVVR